MSTLKSLIAQARAQDATLAERHNAFGELVKHFQDLAFGCAYAVLGDAHLAQDVAQEAFITAYHNLAQLRDAEAFPAWLRRITLTHYSRLTRRKRLVTASIEASTQQPSQQPDPARIVEQRELQETILAAIMGLPEHERMAVLLFYISGYSLQDIAIFLEVPVTTVKKRLQYARQRLKERMLEVVHDDLQARRPSNDEDFVRTVQFLTALDAMAAEHQMAVEDLLLHDGIDELELDADGEELLTWAAQRGHVDVVDLLLHDGVDANARDADGRTLLSCAVQRGDLDLAALLLRFGVDANTRDTSGKTPLQWAVEHGYQEIVALLREHGGSAPPR